MAGRLGVVTLAEAVSYLPMLRAQEALSAMVKRGDLPSLALALTHKPVFTLGKRGEEGDILERDASNLVTARGERIEVVRSNRGGEVTYHGPGQLVVYPIVDLRRFDLGARRYVEVLEDCVVETLGGYGISGRGRMPGATGVWVGEKKIAAIGVRISRGVSTHGLALNIAPDLSLFTKIVPCGLKDKQVTSMARELGHGCPQFSKVQSLLLERLAALVGAGKASPFTHAEEERLKEAAQENGVDLIPQAS